MSAASVKPARSGSFDDWLGRLHAVLARHGPTSGSSRPVPNWSIGVGRTNVRDARTGTMDSE
eukprot:3291123-Heterocapsa_arctica.AAC.1